MIYRLEEQVQRAFSASRYARFDIYACKPRANSCNRLVAKSCMDKKMS